jgi:hypothetical protein
LARAPAMSVRSLIRSALASVVKNSGTRIINNKTRKIFLLRKARAP